MSEGEKKEFKHRRHAFLQGGVKQLQQWVVNERGEQVNSSSDEERHPSWNEALIDLAIVASFTVLDDYLDDVVAEQSGTQILWAFVTYVLCFSPLFNHWQVLLR
jgi:hypothetical protein